MRHLARLVAGGQEFPVEGAESLLEAALRAGLGVPYGCSNGNCGACKARIVDGNIRQIRVHDFRLTEAEKLRDYALMCCSTALTDLVIDTGIAQGAGDIPWQSVGAQVRRLEPLAADIVLLELFTPRSQRLRFLAGQSATLDPAGQARPCRSRAVPARSGGCNSTCDAAPETRSPTTCAVGSGWARRFR